jgi:hypothetical protein
VTSLSSPQITLRVILTHAFSQHFEKRSGLLITIFKGSKQYIRDFASIPMISNPMNSSRNNGILPTGSSSHERIRKAKTAKVLLAIDEDQRKRISDLIVSIVGALTGTLERYRENSINMGLDDVNRLRRLNTHQALNNMPVPSSSMVTPQYNCVESK